MMSDTSAKGAPAKTQAPLNSDQFSKLVQGLADDIVDAHIHWRMHCDLVGALNQAPIVHGQSPTFWHYTVRAHEAAALGPLCHAYDQEGSALHLKNWLEAIRDNLDLFERDKFRRRLAGNPHAESLAQDHRAPDAHTLAGDIALVWASDPLVKKLQAYRNTAFAHRGAKVTLMGRGNTSAPQLTVVDVDKLLERARAILSRCTILFRAEVHSVHVPSHDDYGYIFRTVEENVARVRREARARALLIDPGSADAEK